MATSSSEDSLGIDIKSSDIILLNETLGRGGYGEVVKGTWREETVAVKKLLEDGQAGFSDRDVRDLKSEARILLNCCKNDCIVDVKGIVLERNFNALVLEYMHFGNVLDFLKDMKSEVPLAIRVNMIEDVISGMLYLHQHKVYHLDLKAQNVLINNFFNAKICDFGLATFTKTITATTRRPASTESRRGTLPHLAPELFKDINLEPKAEQDVYAFAVTVWEIFSGKIPYGTQDPENIKLAVIEGQRPNLSVIDLGEANTTKRLQDLVTRCWDGNSSNRPPFEEISKTFSEVYDKFKKEISPAKEQLREQIKRKFLNTTEQWQCTAHFDAQATRTRTNHSVEVIQASTPHDRPWLSAEIYENHSVPPPLDLASLGPLDGSSHLPEALRVEVLDPDNSLPGPCLTRNGENAQGAFEENSVNRRERNVTGERPSGLNVSHPPVPDPLISSTPDGPLNAPFSKMALHNPQPQMQEDGARRRVNFNEEIQITKRENNGRLYDGNIPPHVLGDSLSQNSDASGATGNRNDIGNTEDDVTMIKNYKRSHVQFEGLNGPESQANIGRNVDTGRNSNASGIADQSPVLPSRPSVDQMSGNASAMPRSGRDNSNGVSQNPGHPDFILSVQEDQQPGVTPVRADEHVNKEGGVVRGPPVTSQSAALGVATGPGVTAAGGSNSQPPAVTPRFNLKATALHTGNIQLHNSTAPNVSASNSVGVNSQNIYIRNPPFAPSSGIQRGQERSVVFGQRVNNEHVDPPNILGQPDRSAMHPVAQGTNLLDAYQQSNRTHWQNPNPAEPMQAPFGYTYPAQQHNDSSFRMINPAQSHQAYSSSNQPPLGQQAIYPPQPQVSPYQDQASPNQHYTSLRQPQASTAQNQAYLTQQQHITALQQQQQLAMKPVLTNHSEMPRQFQHQAPPLAHDHNPATLQPRSSLPLRLPGYIPAPEPPQVVISQTHVPVYSAQPRRPGNPTNIGAQQYRHTGRADGPIRGEIGGDQGRPNSAPPREPSMQDSTRSTPSLPSEAESSAMPRNDSNINVNFQTSGGSTFQIQMPTGMSLPPNIQFGSNNYMVVNQGRGGRDEETDGFEGVARSPRRCRIEELPASQASLSNGQLDTVASEIGKDWRKLCRKLSFTDAEIEHLEYDNQTAGLYETTYQALRKWKRKIGDSSATVNKMAVFLWEINRQDVAFKLNDAD